jgi:hypothetical protein
MGDHAPEHHQPPRRHRQFTTVKPIGHAPFQHKIQLDLAMHVWTRHAHHIQGFAGAKAMIAKHHVGMAGRQIRMGGGTFIVKIDWQFFEHRDHKS